MIFKAKWIKPKTDMNDVCPLFIRTFTSKVQVKSATLAITALGVYEATLNGKRVGEFILAPGWTTYKDRLQYQEYDVTNLLKDTNHLEILVGKGWYRGRLPGWKTASNQENYKKQPAGMIATLEIHYHDGSSLTIHSDESWSCRESKVRFSELYDGETFDASFETESIHNVEEFDGPTNTLILQEGEEIREQDHILPARLITTPKGELVLDFGQIITGYLEIQVNADAHEVVELSHGEVLDKDGNFYNENYRSAKSKYIYICKDGLQSYKPKFTFYGFRYIRIDSFPKGIDTAKIENFKAIVIHSKMCRTGNITTSNPMLNKLFRNIIWGQKGNFVDVPTDCPQRDERLGWTGDAQVFIKTAALNFDVEKFFTKWLKDMASDQEESGGIPHVIPDVLGEHSSSAWADAVTICPWELYMAYGNKRILENQYEAMTKWVNYITNHTKDTYLWTGGSHFGDWLGLDAPSGSYKGSSREDFIASAFYAYSTSLVIKTGKVLGKDVTEYENLYENILKTFQSTYPVYFTQTECILAAHFRLSPDCKATVDQLATMIIDAGVKLQTGFVGTPYLLHVLSDYGYEELAYSLLLRDKYPSWLYPVTKGATTIWEHWDGIMENGDFWSANMNSFNHYAYGAVADWLYGVCAGIKPMEDYPGYEKVQIHPHPDKRLDMFKASLETRHGHIHSEWTKEEGNWRYDINTPVDAVITIADTTYELPKGQYVFFSPIN